MTPKLFDYWRSTASYRVRIALNLKGIDYTAEVINLLDGSQRKPDFLTRNPQGLLPVLEIDGHCLTQSLAIIEYLDETRSEPRLLPADPLQRARVNSLAFAIAMEIHPVCNLKVAAHVVELTNGGDSVRKAWMQKFIHEGLAAFEAMLDKPATGSFCHGDRPTLADCCLIPQLYNADRWQVDLEPFRRIRRVRAHCNELEAFRLAYPDAN